MKVEFNNEVADSVNHTLGTRLSTPVYGVFFISWAILHWEFLYSTFFLKEKLVLQETGLLKNDYLIQTFFDLNDWYFYISWAVPFILTWFIIWKFPDWVLIPAYKKDIEDKQKKIKFRIQKEQDIAREKTLLEKTKAEETGATITKTKEEKELAEIDPTIEWEKEFKEFKKSALSLKFEYIMTSLYQEHGQIKKEDQITDRIIFQIPKDILAYVHSNGLVTFDQNKEKIELTDKGRYFVKRYSEEK